MARGLRFAFLALISIGSLAATLYFVGINTVVRTLGSIHWSGIALAAALVVANSLLSLVRFRSVLRGLGFHPNWRSLFFAHSIGQVSNQIFLNIIGQSLSRAAALAADGVPFSASVIATYWERIQAAAVLFLLSLASLWYLFVNIHFDLLPAGLSLLSLLGALAATSAVVAVTALRPAGMLDQLGNHLRAASRLWPSVLITLLAHACMLGAYLSLLWGLDVMRADGAVIAALIVVMFTSSLPISFSGWGIRELSAAQALGSIGISESVAVASAVAIGLLYLFLVVVFAVISTVIVMRHRKKYAARQQAVAVASTPGIDWSNLGLIAGSVLCALLLFFQLRIPTSGSELTANIADLIALTSLGLAPYFLWTHRQTLPLPRVLLAGLAGISLVILFSLVHGYVRFGWTSWAFLNRGLGWLILLGYAATGIAVALATDRYRRVVLATFVATGTTVAVLQIGHLLAMLAGVKLSPDVFVLPLRGYAGNSNAFAVQMIMTAASAMVAYHLGIFGRRNYMLPLILSVIAIVIYFGHSRAGLGMFGIALAVMMLFPAGQARLKLLPALLWPIVALLISSELRTIYAFALQMLVQIIEFFAPNAAPGEIVSSAHINSFAMMLQVNIERQAGDLERWTSISDGWAMWLEAPIFGSGLGAFMHHYLTATGGPLIIHSVPVWLLAETGVTGLLVVGTAFLTLLHYAWRHRKQPVMAAWATGMMVALICLAAGAAVHDFFYQRSFWFLLGLFAALPNTGRTTSRT